MAKKKRTKGSKSQPKPTHWIVAVPNSEGTYTDPDGRRVNLHKFPLERTVATGHPKFKGTTITDFVAGSDYRKA